MILNVPVFDTVNDAVERSGASAAIVFVPPPFAADSIMEAADAGIKLCVAITDGIPAKDMIRVKRYMRRYARESRGARWCEVARCSVAAVQAQRLWRQRLQASPASAAISSQMVEGSGTAATRIGVWRRVKRFDPDGFAFCRLSGTSRANAS